MALASDKKVIEDTPGEMVKQMRLMMNQTLDMLVSLVDEIENAADFSAAQTALTNTVQPLVGQLRKIVTTLERPAAPAIPTVD